MMIKEILKDADRRMNGAIEVLHDDFKHLRTGRASTQMLDGVSVDYYGTPTPVSQVGSMHVPDPALIVIQPWEPKMLPLIEKAIMNADLGLNPTNDGKVIRVPVPALTEERRREISKKAHDMAESARTAVRQVRRDANDKLKKLEKDHEISQDDEKRALDDVQKLTDQHVEEINESLKKKEAELMEV